MIPLGTLAPEFCLTDVRTGKPVHYSHQNSHPDTPIATVVFFICNHCPYVKYVIQEIIALVKTYQNQAIQFFAINANDIESYPDDSPEHMQQIALEKNYPFPYLYDETQEVALAYGATCTPDFFVFDHHHLLVYRGQLDDARPGNGLPITGHSLRNALDCLIHKQIIPATQKPSLGCNIKWRKDRSSFA